MPDTAKPHVKLVSADSSISDGICCTFLPALTVMDGTHVAIDRADASTRLNTGGVMPSLGSKKAEKIGGTLADSENFFELESSIARLKKREALLALYQSKPMYHLYKSVKAEAKAKAIHAKHSQDSEEDETCWDTDLPDTPKAILPSKREWEHAFYQWRSAMRRVSFQ